MECDRASRTWLRLTLLPALLAGLAAGCATPAPGGAQRYKPPPPLSLVAITDASGGELAAQLQQLERVVGGPVTPSETVVVTQVSTGGLAGTYVVHGQDNLAAIAAASGVTLAALEAANPQLGPVAGRDWNRIYPGDRVSIPGGEAAPANLLVSRAPAGPTPPELVRMPSPPANATTFQTRQYEHAASSAKATNDQRVADWRARTAAALAPWQRQVTEGLRAIEQDPARTHPPVDRPGNLGASMQAAVNTLNGLPGRRVLLLLDAGPGDPPDFAGQPGALAGIHLVVANVAEPAAVAAWSSRAAAGGAAVTALDPALTDLQLPAAVTG